MRLTRKQIRVHEGVMGVLSKDVLTANDREAVLRDFDPATVLAPGKFGAFFTPPRVADALGWMGDYSDAVVFDLAAGIGSLAYAVMASERAPKKVVCIEQNHEFVEIGKKLVPDAIWVKGSIYDEQLIRGLAKRHGPVDWAVSNPPYGLKIERGGARRESALLAVEVAMSITKDAMFLLPSNCVPWRDYGVAFHKKVDPPPTLSAFMQMHPEIVFGPTSLDLSEYDDDWPFGITRLEMVHLYRN